MKSTLDKRNAEIVAELDRLIAEEVERFLRSSQHG